MAPPNKKSSTSSSSGRLRLRGFLAAAKSLALDPTRNNLFVASLVLLLSEAAFNALIIRSVPYTEIDWVAYMQEVSPVIRNGTFDYSALRGDTGPLVYPAGFVWIFSLLYLATSEGADILLAQCIYAILYLVNLALVFRLMAKTQKVPPFALLFMSLLTKRIHSIFVLRLFNDPVAMVFLYAAVNMFLDGRWTTGSILFSLAVSVKMNVLMFAPALLLAYLANLSLIATCVQLFVCAFVQVLLALPFLMENPLAYIKGSFDLGRVFLFKWTVNWRFMPEEVFVSRTFHLTLMAAHITILLVCAPKWWKMLRSYHKLQESGVGPDYSSQLLVLPLFMCNFIGISLARSLHYQFYVWYFHQLPYLLWYTKLPTPARLLLLGLVELCWNVYPSTVWSSALLHACHFVLLTALLVNLFGITSAAEKGQHQAIQKKVT